MKLLAGTARTNLTPFYGVELTGWGYYLQRTWQHIHDDLYATAVVLDDGSCRAAIVSLDLMVIDEAFTKCVRDMVYHVTGIPPEAILVACTHTHSAPSAGGLLGVGEVDPDYEQWAAKQAATAVILAWQQRESVGVSVGNEHLTDLTFNRTRDAGPVDSNVTVLRFDRLDDRPMAILVNFQAHPTVHTVLRPHAISRDVPGQICDAIESRLGGDVHCLYLQGSSGDVNFLPRFSTDARCDEPAARVADVALGVIDTARPINSPRVAAASVNVQIPTRRWQRNEIQGDREEAEYRLRSGDATDWRASIGRVMTNRPDDMVARHGGDEWKAVAAMCRFNMEWTDRILRDFATRPEFIETEVQAIAIGDIAIVANASEFFSSLALDVRRRSPVEQLMIVGYSNGRVGYLPDAHDIRARSYAAWQSPKYCNQFPFTEASGPAMCDAMLQVLGRLQQSGSMHC